MMMLRRLTKSTDIFPLKNLVDVLEPVKNYNRGAQKKYTSFSPLTRVVDAARPDAKVAREFRWLVDRLLENPSTDQKAMVSIEKYLTLWKDNHSILMKTIQRSPVLREVESMSADCAACGKIGLDALGFIKKNKHPDRKWLEAASKLLKDARKPRAQVELMIVLPVEKLVKKLETK